MASTTRMTKRGDKLAAELARMVGKDKTVVIELALEKLYHEERMRRFNNAYVTLTEDATRVAAEQQVHYELEGTLQDGIDDA